LRAFHCVPVWVEPSLFGEMYNGFCKGVLWPVLHNVTSVTPPVLMAVMSSPPTIASYHTPNSTPPKRNESQIHSPPSPHDSPHSQETMLPWEAYTETVEKKHPSGQHTPPSMSNSPKP